MYNLDKKEVISVTNLYKSKGIVSIVLGILANVFMFTDLGQISGMLIPILLIGSIGLIISVISIVLKYEKKWISIIGLLLNVSPLAYFAILYFGLG